MAVSVDTVYQRVLALANKEQRGYITPQEYNLLANQAQMGIFEEYFHHLNQYLRNPGNNSTVSDSEDYIQDKISRFHKRALIQADPKGGFPLPTSSELYRLELVEVSDKEAQQVTARQYRNYRNGVQALKIGSSSPVYLRESAPENLVNYAGTDNFIRVFDEGEVSSNIYVQYVRTPMKAHWDYVVVNEKALYNASGSTNFDLHPSEETNLVYKILELSGVVVNKPGLSSYAKTEVVEQSNTEKS